MIILKVLIIYLSLTGRTKRVSEIIAEELTNYQVDIEPITYNDSKLPGPTVLEKVEKGDLSSFTFNEHILNPDPYHIVIFGVPTWGGRPAYFFDGYIAKCTVQGKNFVVFNTCRFLSNRTPKKMKDAIESKGGKVIYQKMFKSLFEIKEKPIREFGQIINKTNI